MNRVLTVAGLAAAMQIACMRLSRRHVYSCMQAPVYRCMCSCSWPNLQKFVFERNPSAPGRPSSYPADSLEKAPGWQGNKLKLIINIKMEDKTINCRDCQADFTWSVADQVI